MFYVTNEDISSLVRCDPDYRPLAERFGLISRTCHSSVFEAIAYTVISQQISSKALNSIITRIGKKTLEDPVLVLEAIDKGILKLSSIKKSCLQNIAEDFISGELTETYLGKTSLQTFKNTLLNYKGIGPWSLDMLCIFYLKRKDIFAISDFGVRRGYCLLKGRNMPDCSKKELKDYGASLKDNATIACFYLWELSASTNA